MRGTGGPARRRASCVATRGASKTNNHHPPTVCGGRRRRRRCRRSRRTSNALAVYKMQNGAFGWCAVCARMWMRAVVQAAVRLHFISHPSYVRAAALAHWRLARRLVWWVCARVCVSSAVPTAASVLRPEGYMAHTHARRPLYDVCVRKCRSRCSLAPISAYVSMCAVCRRRQVAVPNVKMPRQNNAPAPAAWTMPRRPPNASGAIAH